MHHIAYGGRFARLKGMIDGNKPHGNRAAYLRAWHLANRERRLIGQRLRQANNPKAGRDRMTKWRLANPEKFKEIKRRFRTQHREQIRQECRAYGRANKDKINAKTMRRKAAILHATPAWANPLKILEFYTAREAVQELLEVNIEVDHIVPLKSKLVCGLHCEANLQLMTGSANCVKGNRRWPDMP
jgi:hypothetical protein